MRIFICLILLTFVCVTTSIAQTCKPDSISATTPNSQLTNNGDGTITDTKTGLMWKKCVEGVSGNMCTAGTPDTFNWQQALEQPGDINSGAGFAGHYDWRLPNIKELSSIVERQCFDPAINLNRFPNTQASLVWSASLHRSWGNKAWDVNFNNGTSMASANTSVRTEEKQVRLVRGGQ